MRSSYHVAQPTARVAHVQARRLGWVLAVVLTVACGGTRSQESAPRRPEVSVEPSPRRPDTADELGAEGRVRADVIDEWGGAVGPAHSEALAKCHRRGSENVGYALFRRDKGHVELRESDGVDERTLECALRAVERVHLGEAAYVAAFVYVRFF